MKQFLFLWKRSKNLKATDADLLSEKAYSGQGQGRKEKEETTKRKKRKKGRRKKEGQGEGRGGGLRKGSHRSKGRLKMTVDASQ